MAAHRGFGVAGGVNRSSLTVEPSGQRFPVATLTSAGSSTERSTRAAPSSQSEPGQCLRRDVSLTRLRLAPTPLLYMGKRVLFVVSAIRQMSQPLVIGASGSDLGNCCRKPLSSLTRPRLKTNLSSPKPAPLCRRCHRLPCFPARSRSCNPPRLSRPDIASVLREVAALGLGRPLSMRLNRGSSICAGRSQHSGSP